MYAEFAKIHNKNKCCIHEIVNKKKTANFAGTPDCKN